MEPEARAAQQPTRRSRFLQVTIVVKAYSRKPLPSHNILSEAQGEHQKPRVHCRSFPRRN